jgi:L-alanine-DL-glutamate epimerase-like enolase superfamily enzyme
MSSIETEVLELIFSEPFHIARTEESEAVRTVALTLTLDGGRGLGECYPLAYYGETAETVLAVLPRLMGALDGLGPLPADRDAVLAWLERSAFLMTDALGNHGSAKGGLDVALHDLAARALDLPIWELLGTSDQLPPTDYSLGLDEPAVVAERAQRAARFPALKIKVGGPSDIETLEAVRAVYGGALRVDANTAWQPEQAARLIPELERLGVELVEQPFPARALPELRWLRERSSLPILADESAVFEDDLPALDGVVDGIVVKLAKCGGIGPGLRMIRRARQLGMSVMLGCMAESSIGVAAGAMVACEVDWLDLDGNLMLVRDPFTGIELGDDCRWQLTDAPGLGIVPRPAEPAAAVAPSEA